MHSTLEFRLNKRSRLVVLEVLPVLPAWFDRVFVVSVLVV